MSVLREFGYRSYSGSKKSRIFRLWAMSTFDIVEAWKRSRFAKILVVVLAFWQIFMILIYAVLFSAFAGAGLQASTVAIIDEIELPGGVNDVKVSFGHYYLGRNTGLLVLDSSLLPNATYSTSSPIRSLEFDLTGLFLFLNLGDGGVEILETSIPYLPNKISNFTTPGTLNDLLPINGPSGLPEWLFIADGDSGIQIVNVSDPFLPTIITEVDTAGIANALAIQNQILYLADGDNGLLIMNITVPTDPEVISQFNTPNTALDVSVTGNYTFVSMGESGILILNTTDPLNPSQLNILDTAGTANQVVAFGNRYALVADGTEGVQGIYIPRSNPFAPRNFISVNTTSFVRAITFSGTGLISTLYIAEESGMRIGLAEFTEDLFEEIGLGNSDPTSMLWSNLLAIINDLSGILILAIMAVLGGGMIANDKRSKSFDLYLTRVQPHEYLLGKFLALFSINTILMLVPGIILTVTFTIVQSIDLLAHLDVPIAFFILVMVAAFVESSILLALSSLTDRSLYAAVGYFLGLMGLSFITGMALVGAVLADPSSLRLGYLTLISPIDTLVLFGHMIKGDLSEIATVEPWPIIAVLGALIIASWSIVSYTLFFRRE
ncbi:MAG: ABC transporter permease subunit [Candidatus Hermodarchaeota archaeon]